MRRAIAVFVLFVVIIALPIQFHVDGQTNKRADSSEQRKIGLIDLLPSSSKRYALIIGVDQYEDSKITPLKGATNDARTLADALKQYAGFPSDQVVLLTTDQPSERQPKRNTILEALSNLASAARRDGGMLLVSFAGHGIERDKKPYLLSSDARLGNDNDVDLLEDTAVSVNRMKDRLLGLEQVVLILDACRNDPSAGRASKDNPLTDNFKRGFSFDVRNKEVKAFATLYATSPGEISYEYREKGQGYFTWALVEALKGNVPEVIGEKGEITLGKLAEYLKERVPKLVTVNLGKRQEPSLQYDGYKPEQLVISIVVNVGGGNVSVVEQPAQPNETSVELEFWKSIQNSADPKDFKAYLDEYPNGKFARLAKNRLDTLEPAAKPPAPTTSSPNTSAEPVGTAGLDPALPTSLASQFVKIPAREFMMGSNNSNQNDERPAHRVRISRGFEMGKYEVTQAQWEAVMGSNPSNFKGVDLPVEQVSWEDVQQFIQRLNDKSRKYNYRLPTEAEWEYACRAGNSGDYAGVLDQMAWYGDNSGSTTHPVGQKQANAWGLYDMHGNVWEWCQDWYDANYYSQSSDTDPTGPNTGSYRVKRGGGWYGEAAGCRSAYRGRIEPGLRNFDLGFRLLRTAKSTVKSTAKS